MLDTYEIETLRNYFAPAPETVKKLPDKKSLPDWTMVNLLKPDGTMDLCVIIAGQWYKIAALTPIKGV